MNPHFGSVPPIALDIRNTLLLYLGSSTVLAVATVTDEYRRRSGRRRRHGTTHLLAQNSAMVPLPYPPLFCGATNRSVITQRSYHPLQPARVRATCEIAFSRRVPPPCSAHTFICSAHAFIYSAHASDYSAHASGYSAHISDYSACFRLQCAYFRVTCAQLICHAHANVYKYAHVY